MPIRQTNLSAMLIALAAFITFSCGDALVRSMAGQWPGTAIATLRYGAAAIGLGVGLLLREGRAGFACPMPWVQLGRGATIALAGGIFFVALGVMPLPDATAIQFTSPMWTALLSAVILRERIGRLQAMLIVIAFIGVLIVLQPNVVAMGPVALLPLGAALSMAGLMMFNRKAAGQGSLLLSQFLIAAIATAFLVPFTILGDLSGAARLAVGWPSASVVAKCLIVAVSGSLGHLLLYLATTRASAASIAPMGYAQILGAILFGWIAFGHPPGAGMLIGAAVIVGAGLLLIRANMRAAGAMGETGVTPD